MGSTIPSIQLNFNTLTNVPATFGPSLPFNRSAGVSLAEKYKMTEMTETQRRRWWTCLELWPKKSLQNSFQIASDDMGNCKINRHKSLAANGPKSEHPCACLFTEAFVGGKLAGVFTCIKGHAVAARLCFAVPNSYKRTIFNTSNSSGSTWICLLAATTIHVGHIMYPKSRLESLHTSGVTWGCGVWLSDGGKTSSCGGHHPKFMSQIWFCEKSGKYENDFSAHFTSFKGNVYSREEANWSVSVSPNITAVTKKMSMKFWELVLSSGHHQGSKQKQTNKFCKHV